MGSSKVSVQQTNIAPIACVVLTASLVFVWPVPHTVTLRDLLLLTLFIWSGYLAYSRRALQTAAMVVGIPLSFYLALSAWILIVALFVSSETGWALAEIKGQWLKAGVALISGTLLGAAAAHDARLSRLVLYAVVAALFVHVVYIDIQAIVVLIQEGSLPRHVVGLTDGSDKSSYLTNMLFCILMAEGLMRIHSGARLLPVSNTLLGIAAVVVLSSAYVESMRNGVIENVSVLFLAIVLFVFLRRDRYRALTAFLIASLIVVLFSITIRGDLRWQSFVETLPIALSIENPAWANQSYPQPLLSDGQTVDWSNYSRIARARVGIELVNDYPLGVGFGRNAFGHAVRHKYGYETSHSHSGLIDFAVGAGIPGVILWLAFLGSLWMIGYRGFRRQRTEGLALLFLTTGFGVRMVLDSTLRDHMLQMFLFIALWFATMLGSGKPKKAGVQVRL